MEVPTKFISRVAGPRYLLLALVFMATSILLVSCSGGGSGSGTNDKTIVLLPATLTVAADSNSINTSENTTISASVSDANGQLMQGVGVIFTIPNNQSGGNFAGPETVQATTNSIGVATVTYTAGSTGGTSDTVGATATDNTAATSTTVITVNALPGSLPDQISLEASFDSIPANPAAFTTIKASVITDDGSNAANVPVDFKIVSGGGSFSTTPDTEMISVTTNSDGEATVQLYAEVGVPGATVRAIVNSNSFIKADIIITFTLGSIEVSAAQNTLLGTGGESTTITAIIFDVNGVVAGAGETVEFSLSDGSFGSLDPDSDVTDTTGEATVEFTAGANAGTVSVIATWKSAGGDISGSTDILIGAPPAFIEIAPGSPAPTTVNVRGTGGQSTSQVSFIVKDSRGTPVSSGYRIMFEVVNGPGGGEAVIPVFDVTGEVGNVSTVLYSGTKSGTVSIRASYYSEAEDRTISTTTNDIVISSGPPVGQEFGISAQYLNISGLWMTGLTDDITVSAGDIYGNPVADGHTFSFKTYNMGGLIETVDITSVNGFATATLTSTATPTPMEGFTFMTVETNGSITTHITSLAVTEGLGTNSILYAGTAGGGVYKSVDSGASWLNISRSSENARFGENIIDPYVKGNNAISIDPDDTNIVYVGTGYLGKGHIYRSLDGGANWNSNNVEEVFSLYESSSAAVLTVVVDGDGDTSLVNGEYVWAGTEGNGALVATNGEDFLQVNSGLSGNVIVRDIVKSPNGGNGAAAELYAATPTGVFCSTNGGMDWTAANNFAGDNINAIAILDYGADDILYLATEDAGVWAGMNQGGCTFSWTAAPSDGLGTGVNASVPVPAIENKGSGTMSTVEVNENTLSEFWTITAVDEDTFSVTGTESGTLSSQATVNSFFEDTNAGIAFTVFVGSDPYQSGDIFTLSTTRDPGLTLKDVFVDPANFQVYALTYFRGDQVEYPAGNVYSHRINPATGLFDSQGWSFANQNLPTYDEEAYLFPQYSIAANNPLNPTELFIGGAGINFYKATGAAGIASGNPQWKSSKSGITNTIMARMPILFSGEMLNMDINNVGLTYVEINSVEYAVYSFEIYIEDHLGNPPIQGSTFGVTQKDYSGASCATSSSDQLLFVEYGDVYTHQGTWRDPNDPDTDNPYEVDVWVANTGCPDEVVFDFIPSCSASSPGCSGLDEDVTYGLSFIP